MNGGQSSSDARYRVGRETGRESTRRGCRNNTHFGIGHRKLLIFIDGLDQVGAVGIAPALSVVWIARCVEIAPAPLHMNVVVFRHAERLRHEIVLDSRVRLDDVSPRSWLFQPNSMLGEASQIVSRIRMNCNNGSLQALTARIQVDDIRVARDARGAVLDLEDVRAILERASRLVRVDRDPKLRAVCVGHDIRPVVLGDETRSAGFDTLRRRRRATPLLIHSLVIQTKYYGRGASQIVRRIRMKCNSSFKHSPGYSHRCLLPCSPAPQWVLPGRPRCRPRSNPPGPSPARYPTLLRHQKPYLEPMRRAIKMR